jgi:hypothetical protein
LEEKKTWQAKSRDLLRKYTPIPHTPSQKTFYIKKGSVSFLESATPSCSGDFCPQL